MQWGINQETRSKGTNKLIPNAEAFKTDSYKGILAGKILSEAKVYFLTHFYLFKEVKVFLRLNHVLLLPAFQFTHHETKKEIKNLWHFTCPIKKSICTLNAERYMIKKIRHHTCYYQIILKRKERICKLFLRLLSVVKRPSKDHFTG